MDIITDQQYKFFQEFQRREGGVPKKALLAQEKALVQPHLVLVDLIALKHEGTFPPEFAKADVDTLKTEDLVFSEYTGTKDKVIASLRKTDIERLDQIINKYLVDNPNLLTELKIADLSSVDPAQAVTLATEIVARSMKYAHQLVPRYKSRLNEEWKPKIEKMIKDGTYGSFIEEENKKYDNLSPDEILEQGEGVCRHYALATMAVYDRLKARDVVGKLKDTYLPYTSNSFDPQDVENHAFNTFVAHRAGFDTVVSVVDPTGYLSSLLPGNQEDFTITRAVSGLQVISQEGIREKLGISTEEILGAVNTQISRLENEERNRFSPDTSDIDTYLSLVDFKQRLVGANFETMSEEFANGIQKFLELIKDKKPHKIWQRVSSIFASSKLSDSGGGSVKSIGVVLDFSLKMTQRPQEEEWYFIKGRLSRYKEEYLTFSSTVEIQEVLRKIDELDKKWSG